MKAGRNKSLLVTSRDASGSYEYYHADGLGSTRQLSNDSQIVTQTTTYDAFGNIESSTGSSNNVYKYAGQWGYRNDGDDGLMHVGARDYDPLVGRFVQADTYLGAPLNPQSLNRYNYCEGDPVNHVDPTGHSPVHVVVGAGVVIYKVYKIYKIYKKAQKVKKVIQYIGHIKRMGAERAVENARRKGFKYDEVEEVLGSGNKKFVLDMERDLVKLHQPKYNIYLKK